MLRARFLYRRLGIGLAVLALGLWAPFVLAQPNRPTEPQPGGFKVDPFWPQPLPDTWVTGEVAGTCVDANDHLFTVNRRNLTAKELQVGRPSPALIEFNPSGRVVNSSTPPVLPTGLHGCLVDYQGNVWIGGNGDAIVQKYSHDLTRLLLQIGEKGHFDSSDGTANGTPLNSSQTLLNRPADIAVDSANGDVYIADGYGNHRVVVFDRDGHFLRQWGEAATQAESDQGVGGKFLATVHSVNLGRVDGMVYVNDRKGDRIQVFDKMGHFQRNIWIKRGTGTLTGIGSAWDLDFSADSTQTYIYEADGGNEVLWTLGRASGDLLAGFGRPGHMAGEFTFLHTVAVDSHGNLYTGETVDGRRAQKFVPMSARPEEDAMR
jgi:hypothetical protein